MFANQLDEVVGRTRRTIGKFFDSPLLDRTGLDDPIGGQPAPPRPRATDRALPPFSRTVTLMELNRFAGANREWGLYHMDADYARGLGLAGPLVLEHLKLAYLANLLEDWLGDDGRIARIGASFLALDIAGTTLTAHGQLDSSPASGGAGGGCTIWIEDASGRAGTIGTAIVLPA